MYVREVGS